MLRLCLFLSVLLFCGFDHGAPNAWADEFSVDQVIKALKEDIRTAQGTQPDKPRLQIDRVELDLAVSTDTSGEGGIKLSVAGGLAANIGAGGSQSSSQSIKLTLTPEGEIDVGAKNDHGLSAVIASVKNALRNAINEPPKLKLAEFVYETEFGIERTAQGGISFFIIDIAGVKHKQSTTHRLKIYFSLAKL